MKVDNIVVTYGDNDFGSIFQDTLRILSILTTPETFDDMEEEEVISKVKSVISFVNSMHYNDESTGVNIHDPNLQIKINVTTEEHCRMCQSVYILIDYANGYELYTTS